MVRNISGSFITRDIYTPRDQWSTDVDRCMIDSPINPNHFSAFSNARSSEITQTPAIETALRERCGIHVKDFAMIATLEDGSTATFTSEKLVEHEKYLFNQEFRDTYFRQAGYCGYPSQASNDFDSTNDTIRRQSSSTDSSNSPRRHRNRTREYFKSEDSDDEDNAEVAKKGRKRLRVSQIKNEEKKPPVPQSIRMRNLRIGDTAEVTKFYEGRFRDIQQAACKIIAKAFVKVVEPKKQTNFPYTGGLQRAPNWWPTEARMGAPHGVKHKEPDHLLKPERITLLVHILRLGHMKGMDKEHVTIKELSTKTKEAMLTWFSDKPENKAKSKYLDELFKVARSEERYRNGEIDGTYTVAVMHGADQGAPDLSEDEDDEDGANDEDEDAFSSTMTPPSSQICTPESTMVSPISNHSVNRPMSGNTVSNFGGFQREMPVRHFPNANTSNNLLPRPEDTPTYENDSLGMGVQTFIPPRMSDMHPNHGLPEHARRTTWNSPSSYPTNSSSVFTNWTNNNTMIPTNPVNYNYHHGSTTPTPLGSNAVPHLPLPNTPSTSLLPPMHHRQQNFNDSPTMSFRDQSGVGGGGGGGNSTPLRSNSLSNPHHHQYHGQQATYNLNEYMNDYSQADAVMKGENLGGGGGGS